MHGRFSRIRRSTVLGAVVAAVAVLLTATAATARPAIAAAELAWVDCGGGLQCATVPVPLDYARPAGPAISIALIRFPASDQAHRVGSLFINPGGPGGSGVQTVRGIGATFDQLLGGRFDIVGFDPRGVGASTSVRCFTGALEQSLFYANESVFPVGPAAERRYTVKLGVFTGRCGARSGALLPYLSTEFAARDLDRLRAAVGDDALTYLGLSYGTALGATYANLFPSRVRALVLDGVTDPVTYTSDLFDWTAGSVQDTEQVLAGFIRTCAAAGPQRCALAGSGDVRRRIDALLARLRRTPVPAPNAPVPTLLDYPTTQTLIFNALYTPPSWPALAAALVAAEHGDGSPLLNLAAGPAGAGGSATAAATDYDNLRDAQAGILCTDSPAPRDPARWPAFVRRLERISPTAASAVGWLVGLPCASWPAQAASRYTGPWNARTSHQLLLVGTTHDPVTPLASARKLARLMGPSAVLLTHDGFGHSSFGEPSTCTLTAEVRYILTGALPAAGTVCTADTPPFGAAAARAATPRVPYPVPLPSAAIR
jgi:pimeloyl-ACP methyl ester carboxylesterase